MSSTNNIVEKEEMLLERVNKLKGFPMYTNIYRQACVNVTILAVVVAQVAGAGVISGLEARQMTMDGRVHGRL
jgi:hypothetical protein